MNVSDQWGRDWLRSGAGRDWLEAHDLPRNPFFAPDRECSASDPHPVLQFTNLNNGTVVTETSLPITGIIDVKNGGFTGWRLEYGVGQDPAQWTPLMEADNRLRSLRDLYRDLSNIRRQYYLRLISSWGRLLRGPACL